MQPNARSTTRMIDWLIESDGSVSDTSWMKDLKTLRHWSVRSNDLSLYCQIESLGWRTNGIASMILQQMRKNTLHLRAKIVTITTFESLEQRRCPALVHTIDIGWCQMRQWQLANRWAPRCVPEERHCETIVELWLRTRCRRLTKRPPVIRSNISPILTTMQSARGGTSIQLPSGCRNSSPGESWNSNVRNPWSVCSPIPIFVFCCCCVAGASDG